jgi:hypothetical protein
MLALIGFARVGWGKERRTTVSHIALGALTVLALIECASIYYWITSAFSPLSLLGVASQYLETSLTYSAYPIAPVLLLIVLFSWLWIPILTSVFRTKRGSTSGASENKQTGKLDRKLLLASLDLLAILSILVFYFLYAAGQNWIVGVDSLWRYLIPLNSLNGQSTYQGVLAALALGHGIYLDILYIIQRTTGLSAFTIVKFAPLILSFLTSSAVFLAFRSSGPYSLRLLTALCALLWFPTTLGLWSGIQANWVAYLLWMLYLASYLNGATKFTTASFIAQSLLSLGILVIHPWTWGVFIATVVVSSSLSMLGRMDLRRSLTDIISVAWLTVPIGLGAYVYFLGVRSDFTNTLSLYSISLFRLDVMLRTFGGAWLEMFRKWSSFLSPALIIIALIGAFTLTEVDGKTRRYMLAWIAIWCVGSFLAAPLEYNPARPATSDTQLWRMLYISPLPLLLAIGLSRCLNLSSRLETRSQDSLASIRSIMFTAPICAGSFFLFLSTTPTIRLICFILTEFAVFVLASRLQGGGSIRIYVLIVLGLVIMNAAFRSLFPLLIDPHNLIPSSL